MCIFSGPARVAKTRIFARRDGDRQALVYQMTFSAMRDLAMILPLPVPVATGDDAVEFLNLEEYPRFFDDLDAAFPKPVTRGSRGVKSFTLGSRGTLEVHDVGSFEASFVPTIQDFERLDRSLRVSDDLIGGPFGERYDDYGFAVFKLKGGREASIHPMAFTFPSSLPGATTYFPTCHVHDGGTMPDEARFDHALYLQGEDISRAPGWEESPGPVGRHVRASATEGTVLPGLKAWKKTIRGTITNADIVVRV